MAYQPGIPLPSDIPSQSQADLRNNFTQLNNQFKTEHVAFDAATGNGQHKFVTLQRSAGVPPVGTNLILAQAVTAATNPYVQIAFPGRVYSVQTTFTLPSVAIAAGTHTTNLIDFATYALIPQAGSIIVFDVANPSRMIFTPFVWLGGALDIPNSTAQLINGSHFDYLDDTGSVLQIHTSSLPAGINVMVKITGSAI